MSTRKSMPPPRARSDSATGPRRAREQETFGRDEVTR
jgi:hypothetical protein